MVCFPVKLPECWYTGGDPLTEAQSIALRKVAYHDMIYIPFLECDDCNNQLYTKAEAWNLIAMILDGVRPPEWYLDNLGRDPWPKTPPSHPSLWEHCHAFIEDGDMQMIWLDCLVGKLDIPLWVKQRGLRGLTYGQAAWLIGTLREKQRARRWGAARGDIAMFESAVREARHEVPVPQGNPSGGV